MLAWKGGWGWGWKVFSSFSHPPPPLPPPEIPRASALALGQPGAVVQTFYVGQYSVLVSLYPLPALTPPPIITKKRNPHRLQTTINQAAAFPSSKSQVPLPTKSASPHRKPVPDRSEQGFETNCGNLGISSRRWYASWELLFPHLPDVGGKALSSWGEGTHGSLPSTRGKGGTCGNREGRQGPSRESAPLGISCGPVSLPVPALRVSSNLEAGPSLASQRW